MHSEPEIEPDGGPKATQSTPYRGNITRRQESILRLGVSRARNFFYKGEASIQPYPEEEGMRKLQAIILRQSPQFPRPPIRDGLFLFREPGFFMTSRIFYVISSEVERSFKSGFFILISQIFFFLLHFFNCFSRFRIEFISQDSSK